MSRFDGKSIKPGRLLCVCVRSEDSWNWHALHIVNIVSTMQWHNKTSLTSVHSLSTFASMKFQWEWGVSREIYALSSCIENCTVFLNKRVIKFSLTMSADRTKSIKTPANAPIECAIHLVTAKHFVTKYFYLLYILLVWKEKKTFVMIEEHDFCGKKNLCKY